MSKQGITKGGSMNTDLIKFTPTSAMITSYQTAIKAVDEAFDHLSTAKKHLEDIYGDNGSRWRAEVMRPNTYYGNLKKAAEENKLEMKKTMWGFIVEKTQIRHLLSEKKKRELDRMIDQGTLPEVEAETIQAFILNLAANLPDLFEEACCEVFDMLRPPRSEYKTNTEFEIGPKVIMNHMVDYSSYKSCSLEYSREQSLINLDNVFHLLDGKGNIKYPDDLATTIKTAIRENRWDVETEYFRCKWHKKGSLHITFKRMGLVRELNRIAGGNRIKP
jgi:hypothetical protein